MDNPTLPESAVKTGRDNNFGALRLILAVLVIVSHSSEIVDGNRSRELLTMGFGTLSFGEVAVDGFFILSGYLIAKSFISTKNIWQYYVKRILRIVPGYIVAFLASILLVPVICDGSLPPLSFHVLASLLNQIVHLAGPNIPGILHGFPYPVANGSLWTISWEFKCYILASLLGLFGLFSGNRKIIVPITCVILLAIDAYMRSKLNTTTEGLGHAVKVSNVEIFCRLWAAFQFGTSFLLYSDRLKVTRPAVLLSTIAMLVLLKSPILAGAAVTLLGGYLLFYVALHCKKLKISSFCDRIDLSYGIYLYAWPCAMIALHFYRPMHPALLFVVTTLLAIACAFGSWFVIEKPFMSLSSLLNRSTKPAT